MDIKTTPLMREFDAVAGEGPPATYEYTATFLTDAGEVKPLRVTAIDKLADYAGAYSDEIYISVMIGAGDYIHDLHPYRDTLKCAITRNRLTGTDGDPPIVQQVFRAYLTQDIDIEKAGMLISAGNKDAANLTRVLTVHYQLVDPVVDQARLVTAGGRFRNQTTHEVLRHLLTNALNSIDPPESGRPIAVQMVPPSNPEPVPVISVRDDVKLVDLPDVLHSRVSGIYNAGLGHYYSRGVWYVYPTFDVTRFDRETFTLTIFNMPPRGLNNVERTWRRTPTQLIVLATGQTTHADMSELGRMNAGNGVRMADASKFMGEYASVEDNKATVMRASNNSEFSTSPSKTGLNNIAMSERRVTSNMFLELSKLAARQGQYIQLEWQNAAPDLLVPGMPCRYCYYEKGTLNEITGVLIAAETFIQAPTPVLTTRRHDITAALTIFVKRVDSIESESP